MAHQRRGSAVQRRFRPAGGGLQRRGPGGRAANDRLHLWALPRRVLPAPGGCQDACSHCCPSGGCSVWAAGANLPTRSHHTLPPPIIPLPGGILGDHTNGGFRFGSFKATLEVSEAAAATPGQQPAGKGAQTSTPAAAAAPSRPVRSQAGQRSFSEWVSDVAAPSWHLMAAFSISWVAGGPAVEEEGREGDGACSWLHVCHRHVPIQLRPTAPHTPNPSCLPAAPGALLLLWPFVFDAIADVCALLRIRPRVDNLQH